MDDTPKNYRNKRHRNCFGKSWTWKDYIYGDMMHDRWKKLNPMIIIKGKKSQTSSYLLEVLFK
jgi:hypothetical protein